MEILVKWMINKLAQYVTACDLFVQTSFEMAKLLRLGNLRKKWVWIVRLRYLSEAVYPRTRTISIVVYDKFVALVSPGCEIVPSGKIYHQLLKHICCSVHNMVYRPQKSLMHIWKHRKLLQLLIEKNTSKPEAMLVYVIFRYNISHTIYRYYLLQKI